MPERRAAAASYVMAGLAVATVIGAPLANGLGLHVGWRGVFGGVTAIALATAIALLLLAPTPAITETDAKLLYRLDSKHSDEVERSWKRKIQ